MFISAHSLENPIPVIKHPQSIMATLEAVNDLRLE